MNTSLVVVRHGQSTWNAESRWQGQADPPLSDLGRSQAVQASRALNDLALAPGKPVHTLIKAVAIGGALLVVAHQAESVAIRILGFVFLIQLHPDLKPLWDDINQHYKRIGLQHSQQVIWDVDMRELGSHIGHQPSVFYFGPNEFKYWGDNHWLETVEHINSKNNFMAVAEELGVDVPKTLCFDSVSDIGPEDIAAVVYPCYLKAAVSVSGVGIYRCEDEGELLKAITRFANGIPVQIQEEVKTDTFLNMQYQVIGDHLIRLAASEQILDGFAHQGNRVPASHEPWDTIEPMAEWLRDQGIKGIFAFDVAVRHPLRTH